MFASKETIFSRKSCISFVVLPLTPLIAIFLAFSFLASNKSSILSASNKLIRPFKKALFVNSPGSAGTAPFTYNNSSILLAVIFPP